jgi:DNA-binding transcriptional ArsR family regulator
MKKSAVIAALGALAQETRLEIFRLLVQRGPQGMPAGEIGARLGQPSPTMSFHLNQLRFAGLVSSRRASRSIIYSANFKAMTSLIDYLTENCCGGRPELCAPAGAACVPQCAPDPQPKVTKQRNRRISA